MRRRNTEKDSPLLKPGDELYFITDLSIFAFEIPGKGKGDYKSMVVAKEGDVVRYLGTTHIREHGVLEKVTLHRFLFMPLNDKGEVISEYPFLIKNVETIIKWSEPV